MFLTFEDSSLNLPKIENEFFDLNKIRIAENDMVYYKSFEAQRKLNFEICITLENVIKTATLFEKRFLRLTDSKENELIIYVTQGQAFIVKCLNLTNSTVTFLDIKYDNNFCNTQLVVEYYVGLTRFRGYMDYDNIINPLDKKCLIHCEELNQTYYFKNKNTILKRTGSILRLETSNDILQMKPIDFELSDISKLNFKHSKLIENGVDFAKEFHSYSYFNERKNQVLNDDSENFIQSIQNSKVIFSKINNWFSGITIKILNVFLYFLMLSLIIFLFYYFRKQLKLICFSILTLIKNKV